MKKIIGIDLGTTNSCVAIMEGNQAKVIENQEGNRTTPSVVSFTGKEINVGLTAKRQVLNSESNVVFSVKRLMGKKFSEVKDTNFPFEIFKSKNDNVLLKIGEKEISPQEISSYILKKIKDSAEEYIGEKIEDAVITVPAYFNDAQRNSTKEAGRIAGLNVRRIINEPTAAALAFGLDKEFDKDKKIAVYDLGGGTFDISIIELANIDGNKQFEVLSTNGDTSLGGDDFDNALVDYIIEDFKKKENYDLRSKKFSFVRIKEEAEKAKKELSSLKETEINIPFIVNDENNIKHLHIKITRAKLEDLVSKLIERTIEPCKTALKDANLDAKDIDEVILVGGMTRMISVQKAVENIFGKKPKKGVNPDEAVAIGAAIQGQILSGQRKDILLLDVIPLSLGIETLGGVMSTMIKKNTTIPTKYSQVFSTAEDNQNMVSVKVFQGERKMVEGNKFLGEFNLEGIRSAPRGVPQIEVTFNVDANGILDVAALDKSTGIKNNIVIKSGSGLSEEEIERMIKDAKKNDEIDKKNKELTELKNELEYLKNDINNKINDIDKKENEDLISECKNAVENSEKALENENISEIKERIEENKILISRILEKKT
ncbi:Chaperone protein DnaK [Candidatus Vidania fulgoroideae]|nr:Chaperone protein DnaK [Candidatus Vidania fulgoroideae]